MIRGLIIIICLGVLASCGEKGPESRWPRGERGTVSRIMDGDTFALNTGQVVKLLDVEAPAFAYRDRKAMPYADEAKRELENLILGREVELYYPGLTRDRYDRALAQVKIISGPGDKKMDWVSLEMVRRGAAWYRFYPDTWSESYKARDLEIEARKAQTGIWADNRLNPFIEANPDALPEFGFVILKDVITASETEEKQCTLTLSGSALLVMYPEIQNGKTCLETGTEIEARGWVNRGVMDTSGLNIEVLKPTPP